MAKKRQPLSVTVLIQDIDRQLKKFEQNARFLSLREKVLKLVTVRHRLADLGVSVAVDHGLDPSDARERIRVYLIENVGEVISSDELAVVSGISEFGRRVRELRVEQGYRILTGASPDPDSGVELRPDDYLLTDIDPDTDAARRWHVAKRIRNSPAGSKQRVFQYLLENVGSPVTTEELSYVAKGAKEFARRVRELRTEDGYAIATRFTGRPNLRMGEYMLLSRNRIAEPHDRHIPEAVQKEVFTRDGNSCRICGWSPLMWSEADPRILELHHVNPHRKRGDNSADNLIVACNVCHDDIHAGRVATPRN
jgi:hypothetical protein